MEHDETVKIRVVWGEMTCSVDVVVVVHDGANFHVVKGTLDNSAIRVAGYPLRKRELIVSTGHGLRTYENEVQARAREKMCELGPGIARKRRLCARAENEETHWRRLHAKVLDFSTATGLGRVKCVPQSYKGNISDRVQQQDVGCIRWYIPVKLLSPSGVSLLSSRRLYGLSSCNILPTVTGYVSILVACLMLLSELMAWKSLVYKNVSQFVIFTIASSNCGPA